MKRYINNTDTFQIIVQVVLEEQENSIQSSIEPVYPDYFKNSKNIDQQAFADYDCFIKDSIEELENADLEIIERHKSDITVTSRYFTLMDLEQDVCKTAKYIIFLRISDHIYKPGEEVADSIYEHRRTLKDKISNQQGHKVIWKTREIIVNGIEYSSYQEALEAVVKLAEEWSEMLKHNRQE